MTSSDGDRQVCVCVLQLLRLRWISKMMLWCRLWSTLSSDALGIAKCVMPESLQSVDALSSIDAVREPLGPATNAWNKCLPVLETTALEHVLCCRCRLERQPLRDSAVTPWLSPIRFPAHYSHLYPQSVNSPQPSNPPILKALLGLGGGRVAQTITVYNVMLGEIWITIQNFEPGAKNNLWLAPRQELRDCIAKV